MATEFLFDGPEDARVTVLLAHGAGAPMDSASMNAVAKALAAADFRVARFEFSYMASRRTAVGKKPPPKAETVMPEYIAAVDDLGPTAGPLIIGGKSMGGRVASMVADALFDAGRIAVVRNGLDEAPSETLSGERSEQPRVVVLSRLVPHKQIEDALDAVAELRDRVPGLHLDIVGGGWWHDRLVQHHRPGGRRHQRRPAGPLVPRHGQGFADLRAGPDHRGLWPEPRGLSPTACRRRVPGDHRRLRRGGL